MSDIPWLIAVHLYCALSATVLGPLVFWTRRPSLAATRWARLHRPLGAVWMLLMLVAALSAVGIKTSGHYSWLHLLVPLTLYALWGALRAIAQKRVRKHRQIMISLYLGACVLAGVFTLLPDRLLGRWFWSSVWPWELPDRWVIWDWVQYHPERLPLVVQQTPAGVWALLAVLVALGALQMRNRWCTENRLLVIGLGMFAGTGISLMSLLHTASWWPLGLGIWLVVVLLGAAWSARRAQAHPLPGTLRYDPATLRLQLPGHPWPLLVLLVLFGCNYLVRVELALRAAPSPDVAPALLLTLVSALCSATLLARVVRHGIWLRRCNPPSTPLELAP